MVRLSGEQLKKLLPSDSKEVSLNKYFTNAVTHLVDFLVVLWLQCAVV